MRRTILAALIVLQLFVARVPTARAAMPTTSPPIVQVAESIRRPDGGLFASHGGSWTAGPSPAATAILVTFTWVPFKLNSHAGAVAGPRLVWTVAVDSRAPVTLSG